MSIAVRNVMKHKKFWNLRLIVQFWILNVEYFTSALKLRNGIMRRFVTHFQLFGLNRNRFHVRLVSF